MSNTIGVEFAAQDAAFLASAKAAASAVLKINNEERKLAEVSKALGLDQRKFAQQFAKQASEASRAKQAATKATDKASKDEAKLHKDAAKVAEREQQRISKSARAARAAEDRAAERAAKKKESDAKRDAATAKRAQDKASGAAKQAAKVNADYTKKKSEAAAGQLKDAASLVGATLGVATAVGAAVAGYVALNVAIGKSAIEAKNLRDNATGFFNVLTRGRGDKTLEYVDGLAGKLGVKLNDARQQMIQFRQAGLGNKQSANLIKLAADLNTVDKSGELASQAIARVLSYTANNTQTRDQVEASERAMRLLAKQAGVAGTGANAAAASVATLAGALNRIDNTKTKVLEKLGDKIAPSADRAATAVANLIEKFVDSKRGQQAIDLVGDSVIAVADAVTWASGKAEGAGKAFEKALANPLVRTALTGLKILGYAAGAAVLVLATGAALLVAPLIALGGAAVLALGALGRLATGAANIAGDMYSAGKNVISGLVRGITESASGAVNAVGDVASKMKGAFKKALGINSPSKVFKGFGVNMGQGVTQGWDAAAPTGAQLAATVQPPAFAQQIRPGAPGGQTDGSAGPFRGSSPKPTVEVTIENLNVPRGEDPDRWMMAAGRHLGAEIQAILLSQGSPNG